MEDDRDPRGVRREEAERRLGSVRLLELVRRRSSKEIRVPPQFKPDILLDLEQCDTAPIHARDLLHEATVSQPWAHPGKNGKLKRALVFLDGLTKQILLWACEGLQLSKEFLSPGLRRPPSFDPRCRYRHDQAHYRHHQDHHQDQFEDDSERLRNADEFRQLVGRHQENQGGQGRDHHEPRLLHEPTERLQVVALCHLNRDYYDFTAGNPARGGGGTGGLVGPPPHLDLPGAAKMTGPR